MDIDGVLPPGVVLPPGGGGGDFFANFFSLSFFENFGKLWKTLAHIPIYYLNCAKLSPHGNGHSTTATNKGTSKCLLDLN